MSMAFSPEQQYPLELWRSSYPDSAWLTIPNSREDPASNADRGYAYGLSTLTVDGAGHRDESYEAANIVLANTNRYVHILPDSADILTVIRGYHKAFAHTIRDIDTYLQQRYTKEELNQKPETHMAAAFAGTRIVPTNSGSYVVIAYAGDNLVEMIYQDGSIWQSEEEGPIKTALDQAKISCMQARIIKLTIDELVDPTHLDDTITWEGDLLVQHTMPDKPIVTARPFFEEKKGLHNCVKSTLFAKRLPYLNIAVLSLKDVIGIANMSDGITTNTLASARRRIWRSTNLSAQEKCYGVIDLACNSEDNLDEVKKSLDDKVVTYIDTRQYNSI